jgi:hypothetical protein
VFIKELSLTGPAVNLANSWRKYNLSKDAGRCSIQRGCHQRHDTFTEKLVSRFKVLNTLEMVRIHFFCMQHFPYSHARNTEATEIFQVLMRELRATIPITFSCSNYVSLHVQHSGLRTERYPSVAGIGEHAAISRSLSPR